MRHARVFAVAGAAALYATATLAADMAPPYVPAPSCVPRGSVPRGVTPYLPYCEEEFGGWYLRGDIGMTNQQVGSLNNLLYSQYTSVETVDKGFNSSPLFGLGIGYQWNEWLRTDVTGEYRGRANFHGLDIGTAPGLILPDDYRASKSEWLFLANAYVDLGTWWHITPFVGAGIGMSQITIDSFRDVGITGIAPTPPILSVAYGNSASTWNFAWALHAGLAYKVTKNVTVEFAYRYVSLGDAKSGDLIGFDGTNNFNNPMEFRNLTSNDFKLGIRWAIEPEFGLPGPRWNSAPVYVQPEPTYVEPQSIYSPPQPDYQPPSYPPVNQQPLRSRG